MGQRRARSGSVAAIALALLVGCKSERGGASGSATSGNATSDVVSPAALPDEYARALALDSFVTDAYLAKAPRSGCAVRDDPPGAKPGERRRTVRARLPDTSAIVVFVRAGAADSLLEGVAVVRKPARGAQLGFTLDAAHDSTQVVHFPAGPGEAGTKELSQGGALAARLRELGRRALGVRCVGGR